MPELKIISAKEAKEQGLSHFFTGVPCKHGHISLRKVGPNTCVTCNAIAFRKAYLRRKGGGVVVEEASIIVGPRKPEDTEINRLLMRKW